MGDEVEMKDYSGMRALSLEQRYTEDTEGAGFEGQPLIVPGPCYYDSCRKGQSSYCEYHCNGIADGFCANKRSVFLFLFEQPVQREVQSMGSGFIIGATA